MKGLIVDEQGCVRLVNDIPFPEPGDYEALVKVECCMICNGTDMEIIQKKLEETTRYPLVLGHEGVGVVVKTGKKVRNIKVGDRVLRVSLPDSEKYYSGWGSFAEYAIVKDGKAMIEDHVDVQEGYGALSQQVVDKDITPEQASLMITLKETCSALRRIQLKETDQILIVGDGPVGLSFLNNLNYMGIKNVDLIGNRKMSLEVAHNLGVRDTFWNKDEEDKARMLTKKYDVYIDTVGNNSTITQGTRVLCEDGILAIYGLRTGDELSVPIKGIRNITIKMLQWPIPIEEEKTHNYIQEGIRCGKLKTKELITHRFSLDNYESGFLAIQNKKALKVNILFS